ncbi:hypothetical protein MHU86_20584 [Fragilaria crotonensis]|nr:hypothetical protein MHU86_20584 [Fragilaria crotonensis]
MEQQVAEAALAMVRLTTDSATRSAASSFLEQWNRTPEAWTVYVKWLQSFATTFHNDNDVSANNNHCQRNPETMGMQLLCLTLLLAKIRREVQAATCKNSLESHQMGVIRNEVWNLLHNAPQALIAPLCSCVAALVARCGQIEELVTNCSQSTSPVIALKLLASLPPEMEACRELTIPQVTAELWPHMELVLDTVRRGLGSADTARPALEALRQWAHTCHITLSHLNSPTCGGTETLLPVLVQILSQPSSPEDLLVLASQALMEAVQVPSDSCTPTRDDAVSKMIAAIPQGFVAAPFQHCTTNRHDDGAHALASLICNLVSEEVDSLCSQPAEALLGLLLQIQDHPHTPVALTVLECWLAVQDIPTNERHEHWQTQLFLRIADGLVRRLAFTKAFTTWQDELDLDEQEFFEFRRMANDVLVNCYFILRVQFLRQLVNLVGSNDWTLTESTLFCMGAISREVCARVKSRGVSPDRSETIQQLTQFLGQLCGTNPKLAAESAARQHTLVLAAACNFLGQYAPAWNDVCDSGALFQLVAYVQAAMGSRASVMEASRAAKSIFVNCAPHLVNTAEIASCMQECMDVALSTDRMEAMAAVAEGSTRLILQMKDPNNMKTSFNRLLTPLLQRADMASDAAMKSGTDVQRELALEALTKYLHVLHVIIRFCDTPIGTDSPLGEILSSIWPLLGKSTLLCQMSDSILNEVLLIQRQVLSNAPALVAPRFPETVKFVVEAYENTKHPSTLDYLAVSVETFSLMNNDLERSFNGLLAHVTAVTMNHVTTEKSPDCCPQVIRAFFEMNQRYLLYCPVALTTCPEFPNIVRLAVECLTACKGERESTRATLIFLSQLFGWKSLRLANSAARVLDLHAGVIDEQLAKHGEIVTRVCISGLGGASPQMLWPALSDCVIAIVTHVVSVNAAAPDQVQEETTTVAHQWVYASLSSCTTTSGKPLAAEPCQQIVVILFALARNGNKSKPKAKMLLADFARLCKGDMGLDALLAYSLDAPSLA